MSPRSSTEEQGPSKPKVVGSNPTGDANNDELLTGSEKFAVSLLGQVAEIFTMKIVGKGPTKDQDVKEFFAFIHGAQQMILSQAAARGYPDQFRKLGESLPPANIQTKKGF